MTHWPFDPMDVALGDLPDQDRTGAEALMAQDPVFAAAVADARRVVHRLEALPDEAWTLPQPPALDPTRLPEQRREPAPSPRRRRRSLAFAVPALAAVVALVLVFTLSDRDGGEPSPLRIQLEPVADARGSVTLTVGAKTAALIARDLPTTDVHHHYEAWVGDATGKMVSMGTFRVDDHGDVTVSMPVRVDLSKYSAVDISLESDDGNPGHSAISVFHGSF